MTTQPTSMNLPREVRNQIYRTILEEWTVTIATVTLAPQSRDSRARHENGAPHDLPANLELPSDQFPVILDGFVKHLAESTTLASSPDIAKITTSSSSPSDEMQDVPKFKAPYALFSTCHEIKQELEEELRFKPAFPHKLIISYPYGIKVLRHLHTGLLATTKELHIGGSTDPNPLTKRRPSHPVSFISSSVTLGFWLSPNRSFQHILNCITTGARSRRALSIEKLTICTSTIHFETLIGLNIIYPLIAQTIRHFDSGNFSVSFWNGEFGRTCVLEANKLGNNARKRKVMHYTWPEWEGDANWMGCVRGRSSGETTAYVEDWS